MDDDSDQPANQIKITKSKRGRKPKKEDEPPKKRGRKPKDKSKLQEKPQEIP